MPSHDAMTRDEYLAQEAHLRRLIEEQEEKEREWEAAQAAADSLGSAYTRFRCASDRPECATVTTPELDGTRLAIRLDPASEHVVVGRPRVRAILGTYGAQ